MTTTAEAAITVPNSSVSGSIRAFYGTFLSNLGKNNADTGGTDDGAVGDNSGCFADVTTAAAATFVSGGGNTVTPNRIFWKSGANWAADIGTPSVNLMLNVDFVLASTYQNSWYGDPLTSRVAANYCDKQVHRLKTTGAVSNAVTKTGLTGTNKCTYFILVEADKGAPAFKITTLDYWKF
jgi:hypothetical protein